MSKEENSLDKLSLVDIKMDNDEVRAVEEVVESGWVTQGPKVLKFEKLFAEFIGTKYAVATSSGTSALQIALSEFDFKKGDEIITTPFTWESTITAILYTGATPVFADIDPKTFNISPKSIEEKINENTKGVVIVHYAGLACNMKDIMELVDKYDLFLVEDSAHAIGSEYKGKRAGAFGDAACFSFGSTKTISTGEGGMITTNDESKYEQYKILRNYGEDKSSFEKRGTNKWNYDITSLSYNFKMNEFAAAIGIVQMEKLPKIIDGRKKASQSYRSKLIQDENFKFQEIPKGHAPVPLFFPILLSESMADKRFTIMHSLENAGIATMIYYPPVYELLYFKEIFKHREINCPTTDRVSSSIFSIPCHGEVDNKFINRINDTLSKFI